MASASRREQWRLINPRVLRWMRYQTRDKPRVWADVRAVQAEAADDVAAGKARVEAASADQALVGRPFQHVQQLPAAAAAVAGSLGGRYS